MVANWINLCFNNRVDFLGTNRKQRKPFLLYLLKTYGFEIFDTTLYSRSPDVVHICRDYQSNQKYLIFENKKMEITFMNGKIAKNDNYVAIEKLNANVHYLDSVILSKTYILANNQKALEKTGLVLARNK